MEQSNNGILTARINDGIVTLGIQNNPQNSYAMQFCERSRRWKSARFWRIYAAFVIFLYTYVCGIDFNLVPGAIYCIEQLENNSFYENRTDLPDYIKNSAIRSNLFGSYDWVAPFVILPTLMLTELGGAEWVFLLAPIVHAITEFILPNLIPLHSIALMVIRAIQGGASGIVYALVGPMCQKHTFHFFLTATVGISISFLRLGMATPLLTAGELCKYGNYSINFYATALFRILISALWFIMMRYDWERRRAINYLMEDQNEPTLKILGSAIWTVFTEYSTYLIAINALCLHFCQFCVFSFGPKFYSDIYDLNLTNNRFFSVMPLICAFFGAPLSGFLVDFLRRRLNFQLSMKIVHSIGMLIPVINMLILASVPNFNFSAVVFFLASTFIFAPFYSATVIRGATAIKPKYSRLVSGLVGTSAWIGFLISPYVVENVTKNRTREEWTIMFYILGAAFATSWLLYLPIKFETSLVNNQQANQ